MPQADNRRWIALTLLSLTQFVLIIDVSIVNVALADIQRSLAFSQEDLQWILSAYTLTFGGLLLLGGRLGDLFGRRRLFLIGLVVFTVGSALCGFAQTDLMLILSRALQGIGAAIISPVALSILTTTFAEGSERNKALGIWGALAGVGGAVGVLAGGLLVEYLSWRWIFLVNVPVCLAVLFLVPRFVDESRGEGRPRVDAAGAISVTGGLALLIYGLVHAETDGWGDPVTIACLAVAAGLIALFVLIESRMRDALLPLSIFRNRTLTGANVVGFLLGAAIFAMFFFLSLYMQQVLGYSALGTGLRYLLVALVIVFAAGLSQALVTRLGVRPVLATGMLLLALGLLYFAQIRVDGGYGRDLVPGFILAGIGLGFAFVPVSIAALQGVEARLAGAASGLINTSQQIGGAVGIAVLSTVANTVTNNRAEDVAASAARAGQSPEDAVRSALPQVLVDGFQTQFYVAAGMALVGLLCTLFIIRKVTVVPGEVQPVAV
ncbi:MAG TPA: MFS transporter [Miltoncostaeaceae bacterium]|nr:MFS transporter [Miltoncostaeaceae bacterium]